MNTISFKRELTCSVENAIKRSEDALKAEGFGILTRIDLHLKIKEKINKEIPITVILGACKPSLAYEAFQKNSDVASLLPCNVVVRDLGKGKVSIEIAKPTAMMKILGDEDLVKLAKEADTQLEHALEKIN
jgi:uncharacterized protein (DUF302 family)